MTEFNRGEEDFFLTALREEARDVIWKTGALTDPETLVTMVLEDLEALAPRAEGEEDRSDEEIWRQIRERLVQAAYATRPYCVRCGTCCTEGSPTLLREDRDLFMRGVLKPEHVTTIRKGETAYSNRTEKLEPAAEEMIKIQEKPDSQTCIFSDKVTKECYIYEDRPTQCRRQECWNPEGMEPVADEAMLDRHAVLEAAAALWEIIQRHEERCSFDEFNRIMSRLEATRGQTVDQLLDILRYDQHVREFVAAQLGLGPDVEDFFFGRPLSDSLGRYGLKAELQPDGTYLVAPVEE
jgi:Fe-S-cluster containining protein